MLYLKLFYQDGSPPGQIPASALFVRGERECQFESNQDLMKEIFTIQLCKLFLNIFHILFVISPLLINDYVDFLPHVLFRTCILHPVLAS